MIFIITPNPQPKCTILRPYSDYLAKAAFPATHRFLHTNPDRQKS